MSSTAVQQPPPALFGQQPPSSPPFSSPQSPAESQHPAQPPMSSPPPPSAEDIGTSASITWPPTGQRHDREDHAMQDGSADGIQANPDQANNIAVEVAPVAANDDAMDTTVDTAQGLLLPHGSAEPPEAPATTPSAPIPNGAIQENTNNSNDTPPEPTGHMSIDLPPAQHPVPADPTLQPPPPPPPVEPVQSDSDSSDDEGGQPWHPIAEDTSVPDEAELKEIEATTEISALDHEHWENRAFVPLEDPEYTPGESGRIEWLIEHYNGTREQPNRELVMKSKPVTIGRHEWQIKFYPKGNDSDYLSVYVECLSVGSKDKKKPEAGASSNPKQEDDAPETGGEEDTMSPELQHTPLPLLDSKTVPKRKGVAAQVSVVLYNPSEPRVHYSRTCLHRFCTSSPDWGWTRFHGPHYDIPHRIRGHRQALLRNDKLAFTGYIRIVNDQTNCLWEHPSSDNVWDSFAMTGLQSLVIRDNGGSPDGNVVSAVASWLLFKPFRLFLYTFRVPDPDEEPFSQPKPLIGALQKVLYMLRTQIQPGAGAVSLEDVMDALRWYGLPEPLHKLDVMQVWEYLRGIIEEELRGTSFANVLEELYGPNRDYTKGVPSYRVPVVGVGSMQEAVNQSGELTVHSSPLSQLLTIELDRQAFEPASRSYVKVLNKVTLDDHINVRDTPYTLYGFVVHKQTLQSYVYQPILRPEGPGSKWYSYSDSREGNKVTCLTQRQAVTVHEGKAGTGQVTGNDSVAYIALYVRDDVTQSAFTSQPESEQWDVPEWIPREVDRQNASSLPPPLPLPENEEASHTNEDEQIIEEPEQIEERDFHIIDSKAFLEFEGPGIFDAYDLKWRPENSDLVHSVLLKATDGCYEVREKIAAAIKDVKHIQDPRQIKFWFVDITQGSFARPALLSTGKLEYSSGSYNRHVEEMKDWTLRGSSDDWGCRRLWVHVVDIADLPELPKESEPTPEAPRQLTSEQTGHVEQVPVTNAPANDSDANLAAEETQPVVHPQSEDTPMSEPVETDPQQASVPLAEVDPPVVAAGESEGDNIAMVDVDVHVPPPDLPVVDVVIPNNNGDDTEMGGTQDGSASLPPPPVHLSNEAIPPPMHIEERAQTPPSPEEVRPRTPKPPPDEIYFFLKFFDAEKQKLEPRGSFIVPKSARLDNTVQKLLKLPDVKLELWEEEDLVKARSLRRHKSFAQNDLHNDTIIIYALPRTDEQREALAARAAFADLQPYLKFRASVRNFPARMNGHFTFNYFSSQYHKGVYVNGHRHGHGSRIYHSGATYEGSFRLGLRHGHGLYTFQNGDTYDGEWVANQQHGTGTFVEATTGNTYTGGWKNDKKFGEGVTHWKSAQETERLCRICWEESADAAFYDCGHVVACVGCARQVENCPVCRRRVLSAMKLYYVA